MEDASGTSFSRSVEVFIEKSPRPTSTKSYSVWDKCQSRSSLSTAPLPSAICDFFMHAEEMNTGK